LQREYRWCVANADRNKTFPRHIVCFGSVTLTPNQVMPWQPKGSVQIAVGNTGGEALSALLADEVASQQSADKAMIEDQLEAMNLSAALQGVAVDYPAYFAQTRHQRGFRGLAGGSRWTVLKKRSQPVSAAEANRDPLPLPHLPDAVAHALNALNAAQEAYDMAIREIAEQRYQTYCDWQPRLKTSKTLPDIDGDTMTKPWDLAEWTNANAGGNPAAAATSAAGSAMGFGRYQPRSTGTSYTAGSDGFVLAGIAPHGELGVFTLAILQGMVDGRLVASATAGNFGCFDAGWNYVRAAGSSSLLMPVPAGSVWRVDCLQPQASQGAVRTWVNWMGIGADAIEEAGNMAIGQRLDAVVVETKPWQDFEPAIGNLVSVLEKLLRRPFTREEKTTLVNAVKQLI
jgi:hypothetical protein